MFPVIVRTSLPEKTVVVFDGWVRRVEDSPPEIEVVVRCGKAPATWPEGAAPSHLRAANKPHCKPAKAPGGAAKSPRPDNPNV